MTLPWNEMMVEETLALEVHAACKAAQSKLRRTKLALGLAWERRLGERSKFHAFVATLPRAISNFVAWPPPLLALMETVMPGTQNFLGREFRELEETALHLPV